VGFPQLPARLSLWTDHSLDGFPFRPAGDGNGIFVLAGIALWGTLKHYGPFQLPTDNQSLLVLQSWAGVLTLTSMTLAAAMTERRRIEAELEQQKAVVESANRTKDNFLAMLSHELRTPLTPVVSFWIFWRRRRKADVTPGVYGDSAQHRAGRTPDRRST
jgi:signal transduction histidine kinase